MYTSLYRLSYLYQSTRAELDSLWNLRLGVRLFRCTGFQLKKSKPSRTCEILFDFSDKEFSRMATSDERRKRRKKTLNNSSIHVSCFSVLSLLPSTYTSQSRICFLACFLSCQLANLIPRDFLLCKFHSAVFTSSPPPCSRFAPSFPGRSSFFFFFFWFYHHFSSLSCFMKKKSRRNHRYGNEKKSDSTPPALSLSVPFASAGRK